MPHEAPQLFLTFQYLVLLKVPYPTIPTPWSSCVPHSLLVSTPLLYNWNADLSASIATDTGCWFTAANNCVSSFCVTSLKPVILTAGVQLVLQLPAVPVPAV